MSTTVKAILYALVVILGTLCNLVTGTGHLTPSSAAVTITGAVFSGAILLLDLKFSHSRAAQIIDSSNGELMIKMLEGKVASGVATGLQELTPVLQSLTAALPVPVDATPATDPTVATPDAPAPDTIPVSGVKNADGSVSIEGMTYMPTLPVG